MIPLKENLLESGRILFADAPEGVDALILAKIIAQEETRSDPRPLLHVARDDARMARLAETFAFFAPRTEILTIPAWD